MIENSICGDRQGVSSSAEAVAVLEKISIRQLKAARGLLGWSQEELAARSDVSSSTIKRLEAAGGELGSYPETGLKIVTTLRGAGIIFIAADDDGPGRAASWDIAAMTCNAFLFRPLVPPVLDCSSRGDRIAGLFSVLLDDGVLKYACCERCMRVGDPDEFLHKCAAVLRYNGDEAMAQKFEEQIGKIEPMNEIEAKAVRSTAFLLFSWVEPGGRPM
jgi:DNA-binding XRE family transcriptional regulator